MTPKVATIATLIKAVVTLSITRRQLQGQRRLAPEPEAGRSLSTDRDSGLAGPGSTWPAQANAFDAAYRPSPATAAGRPGATPHFLRPTGASLAASAGAATRTS